MTKEEFEKFNVYSRDHDFHQLVVSVFREEQGLDDGVAEEQAKFFKRWHQMHKQELEGNLAEAEAERKATNEAYGTDIGLLARYAEKRGY